MTASQPLVRLDLQAHQAEAVGMALAQQPGGPGGGQAKGSYARVCLYHRTGAGKTITSLAIVAELGYDAAVVVAPPITHSGWRAWGKAYGVAVTAISHAKFRMASYKQRRTTPLIVDEFHLLGGHGASGWSKLDRMAPGLEAPLVICSATPNYNDAERVYCIQHVLAPLDTRGGYIAFLNEHCRTATNPYGATPLVLGFRNFVDAEAYINSLPYVHFVEDEAIKQLVIHDVEVNVEVPQEFFEYGFDRRELRIAASLMEARHRLKRLQTLTEYEDFIRPEVWEHIVEIAGQATTPMLVYSTSSRIARAIHNTAKREGASSLLVTGNTPQKKKAAIITDFTRGGIDILVGTATLATGTDGIDKMCNALLIVDDTPDNALRRQLMGRILPRGLDTDVSKKQVWRLVYSS